MSADHKNHYLRFYRPHAYRAARLAAIGHTQTAIAEIMNDEQFTQISGAPLHQVAIFRLLKLAKDLGFTQVAKQPERPLTHAEKCIAQMHRENDERQERLSKLMEEDRELTTL